MQADIYLTHKGKKAKTEAEQILFTAANNYLKGVMNGKTTLPTKAWKAERVKLSADRKQLDRDYYALKLVSPAKRRAAVRELCEAHGISQRRWSYPI